MMRKKNYIFLFLVTWFLQAQAEDTSHKLKDTPQRPIQNIQKDDLSKFFKKVFEYEKKNISGGNYIDCSEDGMLYHFYTEEDNSRKLLVTDLSTMKQKDLVFNKEDGNKLFNFQGGINTGMIRYSDRFIVAHPSSLVKMGKLMVLDANPDQGTTPKFLDKELNRFYQFGVGGHNHGLGVWDKFIPGTPYFLFQTDWQKWKIVDLSGKKKDIDIDTRTEIHSVLRLEVSQDLKFAIYHSFDRSSYRNVLNVLDLESGKIHPIFKEDYQPGVYWDLHLDKDGKGILTRSRYNIPLKFDGPHQLISEKQFEFDPKEFSKAELKLVPPQRSKSDLFYSFFVKQFGEYKKGKSIMYCGSHFVVWEGDITNPKISVFRSQWDEEDPIFKKSIPDLIKEVKELEPKGSLFTKSVAALDKDAKGSIKAIDDFLNESIEKYISKLLDESGDNTKAVKDSLARIKIGSDEFIQKLINLMDDDNFEIRDMASEILEKMVLKGSYAWVAEKLSPIINSTIRNGNTSGEVNARAERIATRINVRIGDPLHYLTEAPRLSSPPYVRRLDTVRHLLSRRD